MRQVRYTVGANTLDEHEGPRVEVWRGEKQRRVLGSEREAG